MNSITQCPACSTLFRVVDDQLRVSQGWVRCGQCQTVFDAQDSLRPESALEPLPEAAAQSQTADLAQSLPNDWNSEPIGTKTNRESSQAVESDGFALPKAGSPQLPPLQSLPQMGDVPLRDSYSFLASKPAPVTQKRSAGWWALFGLLLLGLLLQALWWGRHQVAARAPALAPHLAQACATLGCSIEAVPALDALSVEAVTIQPAVGGSYRVSLVLRNKSNQRVATPAIELSLQDTQDNLVIKRVLLPAELALPLPDLPPLAEVNASMVVQLREPSPVKRVAGYRVVAFYP